MSHRVRSGIWLPALALVVGCATEPDATLLRERLEARGPTMRAAVVRDVPFVGSAREDDCGPSALAAVIAKAGGEGGLERVRAAIHDPERGGAPTSALVRHARELKLFALVRDTWYLDDLKAWIRAGVAPIVLLEASPLAPGKFHYVVLKGYDDDARVVLVQDQTAPEYVVPYGSFFPRWCMARAWALVVCSPAIELPPDGAGLTAHELGALGWLAEERGELEAARRHYRAALAKDPRFEAAKRNLANVERRRGGSP